MPLPKCGEVVSKERASSPEEDEGGGVRSPGGHFAEAGEESHLQEHGCSEEGCKYIYKYRYKYRYTYSSYLPN